MATPATQLSPIQRFSIAVNGDTFKAQLKQVLQSPERVSFFQRTLLVAVQRTPDLLQNQESLFLAAQQCAADGLIPDGREAALIAFGNKVQYLPMIAGILKKVRGSGEVSTIMAAVVYKGEDFKHWTDDKGEHLIHHPDDFAEQKEDDILGAYALACLKDGSIQMEVMSKARINKARNSGRAGSRGPWVDWYAEQAEKTVLKSLAKRLPMSTDVSQFISREDEDDEVPKQDGPPIGEPPAAPEPPRAGSKTRDAVLGALPAHQPAPETPKPPAPELLEDKL